MTQQPTNFRPVIISAEMEHTGTITTRRFDGHPECLVFPYELQLGTKYSRNVMIPFIHPVRYGYSEFPEGTTFERAYELIWNEELKTLLCRPDRSKFRDTGLIMKKERLYELYLQHCHANKGPQSFRAKVVESLFRASIDAWENYQWPEKPVFSVFYNPGMVADTDKILADFPQAHIIHVVRNPWSSYADYLKRPFPQQTLEEYILAHTVAHHLAWNYSIKYPGQFHLVKAEDLMENAKHALTTPLAHIGMTWDDSLLYPSFNGKDLSDYLPPFGTVEKPTTEYNLAVANALSPEIKERIAREAALMIDVYGYEDVAQRIRAL